MDRLAIKKLLLDLHLSVAEIARRVGLSRAGVWKYFDGDLQDTSRRAAIQVCLETFGRMHGVAVPKIWTTDRQEAA